MLILIGQKIYVGIGNTITFSVKLKNITYSTTPSSSSSVARLYLYNDNTQTGSTNVNYRYDEINTKKSVSITSTTDYIYACFGRTSNSNSATFTDIQVEIGSEATSYEPYTGGEPAPSPSYPFSIKNTGDNGSVNEKVQNKNLFIEENMTVGKWLSSAGAESTNANSIITDYIRVPSNRSYVSTGNNANIGTNYFTINQYDINKTRIKGNEYSCPVNTNFVKTHTLENDCVYIKISILRFKEISDFQFELGSTASSYQAHEEQNVSFPLASGQKLMQGDYLADDGVHHKENMIDLSSLSWELVNTNSETGISTYRVSLTDRKPGNNFIPPKCTHFSYLGTIAGAISMYSKGVGIAYYYNVDYPTNTNIYLNSAIATVAELKTWMTNNNVKLQYELATEEIDTYTPEQQTAREEIKALRTYKNVTHISSEDEVPATVELEYVRDINTIDDRITALENAISNLS